MRRHWETINNSSLMKHRQGGLNLIPQRFTDNGLMLAGIGLVLVDHLAPVEAIVEQVIQRPAVDGFAADNTAVAPGWTGD